MEDVTLTLSSGQAKALLNLLDAAISAVSGCAGGMLHPVHEKLSEFDKKLYGDYGVDRLCDWYGTLSDEKKDAFEEDLYELVHSLAGHLATDVNNGGVYSQLRFVADQMKLGEALDALGRSHLKEVLEGQ